MILIVLWNGHLGGTGILVARASWWHGHLGGMGILVESASCPLQFPDGQDTHPTPIYPAPQQCRILQGSVNKKGDQPNINNPT
ncbi:hypothetical protein [Moorena sp. SIO3B2]|uniref:hypothetical protein n=1 Tax=Moorena sp. SIO3B2 TaxID=2607827 RepID=UPI0013C5A30B|nr:hypothetical protein [Moorena sp. SIO3B2]NEP34489.1 hypothetical protein [Moorena sp. SIO3B2]